MKNKPNQSQFISYCVMRDVYCDNEFEKTNPIYKRENDVKSILTMVYGDYHGLRWRENKPNSKPNKANHRPSAGKPKHEARNPK